MNNASQSKTSTFEIVNAATRIVSVLDPSGEAKREDDCRSTARAINAAIAAGLPLDDTFVARTVWDMTRGTYSRAYEQVMPEHGPLISRAAAFKTHPDDLKALVHDGWASGSEDIPTFSRIIDGAEWRMTRGSREWEVTRPDGGTRKRAFHALTANQAIGGIMKQLGFPKHGLTPNSAAREIHALTANPAIEAVAEMADPDGELRPGKDQTHAAASFVANASASSVMKSATASAETLTIPGIAELIAEGRLPKLDAAAIQAAAQFVTESRLDADRSGERPDPALITARDAIWQERAIRAEQARLMEGWTDEPSRESKERAMRGVAERIVKLTRFANAIDEDDGIAPADRARPVDGGREEFDRLAGPDGMAGPARVYVMMRQAQRRGDDATLRVAAAYCESADRGVVSHDEAVTALVSLGAGLTKRMRDSEGLSGPEPSKAALPAEAELTGAIRAAASGGHSR